ncbi:hypothetical protein S7335_925 [Synechococcus sp. PCC 7335]|uniref:hypothetical protein n=1 Tax=Synechococcus sp. (strain ATCC 29403 / PCC 7335) TaxID=91464 RepID=UPI00017EC811|nr:hypothetical protein [Synechococcus sp. PCC 7335]EDX82624.1 hypothetical protein S7335_925 [Synechococcus sp. PCC 7335]
MITDQYSAECQYEQERRAALDDNRAFWTADETPLVVTPPASPVCAQCVNWQYGRQLRLADGTTQYSSGFCTVRAVAELEQMSQDYAATCRLYEEAIPF